MPESHRCFLCIYLFPCEFSVDLSEVLSLSEEECKVVAKIDRERKRLAKLKQQQKEINVADNEKGGGVEDQEEG
jgi:hypothetical protein